MTEKAEHQPIADARVMHEWFPRKGSPGVYDCLGCKMWTANKPIYFTDVCPALDRRTGTDRRRR